MAHAVQNSVIQITNDGRAELRRRSAQRAAAADARAGAAALLSRAATCRAACARPSRSWPSRLYTIDLARTWQSSIGVQRQIGNTMAVEADYVYSQGRNEKDIIENVNLTFNPATGANYPFSDISPPRVSGVRPDLDAGAHRLVQLSRAADRRGPSG